MCKVVKADVRGRRLSVVLRAIPLMQSAHTYDEMEEVKPGPRTATSVPRELHGCLGPGCLVM